jgi:hypothetical protein
MRSKCVRRRRRSSLHSLSQPSLKHEGRGLAKGRWQAHAEREAAESVLDRNDCKIDHPSGLLAASCSGIPRDPNGTSERVRSERQFKVGLIEGHSSHRIGSFLPAAHGDGDGAKPIVERGAAEPLLARLEHDALDLVVGTMAPESPCRSRSISCRRLPSMSTRGHLHLIAAARNGENEWIALLTVRREGLRAMTRPLPTTFLRICSARAASLGRLGVDDLGVSASCSSSWVEPGDAHCLDRRPVELIPAIVFLIATRLREKRPLTLFLMASIGSTASPS